LLALLRLFFILEATVKTHSILLVDDEFLVLTTLDRALDKKKFSIDLAATGEEAIQKLRKKKYDVVLSDMILPGLSGLAVLKEAKKLDPLVGAILFTGKASEQTLAIALDLGISDYMVKPVDNKELLGRIDACIARREQEPDFSKQIDGGE
jgi:two-component system nitrogen regulation response regulator GlnG